MRNERDLRISLNELADQPTPTAALFESITARLDRRPSKRRRTMLVVAMAVVVLIIATTIPQFITNRAVDPADTRVPGNWNLTHRVDNMPAGWDIQLAVVYGEFESTEIGPPAGSDPPQGSGPPVAFGCRIQVNAPGKVDPRVQAAGGEPVIIQGHPGFSEKGNVASRGGVSWPYADDAWAEVVCLDDSGIVDTELSILIAENVVFAPEVARLPFVLADTPPGYSEQLISPGRRSGYDESLARLGLGAGGNEVVALSVEPGVTEIPPGVPGWESDTINGTPAVLNANGETLFLNVQGHSVRVAGPGREHTAASEPLWLPGRRELLVQIAEDLTFASDFTDQSTWFEANKTLPK